MRQPSGAPPAGRVRILIVDDDQLFAEMLRDEISAHEELEVVGIGRDGAEAYALVRELEPSVVLMDAAMPGVDGFEATRLIRSLDRPPAVVFVSGDESLHTGDRAMNVGAAAYFRKTGDLHELIDFVMIWAGLHTHLT
jgi:DNA-binding NarL/FixJ family response regulator